MRKTRHNYSPQEKVFILKRHLVDHVAVSDLCDEYQLQPKIFYGWQKQFFENGNWQHFPVTRIDRIALKRFASSNSKASCNVSMKCSQN